MMYSPELRKYFDEATCYGSIQLPTHSALVGSTKSGHYYFQIQILIEYPSPIVKEFKFICPRCVPAIACGGWLEKKLLGKNIIQHIAVEQIVKDLGGLPPQRCFYAWMAVEAYRQAMHL